MQPFFSIDLKLRNLVNREQGQNLVEYSLLIAMTALVCVAGSGGVASTINSIFSKISNSLS